MTVKDYFLKLYIHGREDDISMLIGFESKCSLKNALMIIDKLPPGEIEKLEQQINLLYMKEKGENTRIIKRMSRKLSVLKGARW
jgi:hypothetical protein